MFGVCEEGRLLPCPEKVSEKKKTREKKVKEKTSPEEALSALNGGLGGGGNAERGKFEKS